MQIEGNGLIAFVCFLPLDARIAGQTPHDSPVLVHKLICALPHPLGRVRPPSSNRREMELWGHPTIEARCCRLALVRSNEAAPTLSTTN